MGLLPYSLREGILPVLGGLKIRYRRELRPFQKYTISSRVIACDDKWIYVEQVIESQGQVCTIAWFQVVLRQKNKSVSLLHMWPRVWPEKPFPVTTPETWERIHLLLGNEFAKTTPLPPTPTGSPPPRTEASPTN